MILNVGADSIVLKIRNKIKESDFNKLQNPLFKKCIILLIYFSCMK